MRLLARLGSSHKWKRRRGLASGHSTWLKRRHASPIQNKKWRDKAPRPHAHTATAVTRAEETAKARGQGGKGAKEKAGPGRERSEGRDGGVPSQRGGGEQVALPRRERGGNTWRERASAEKEREDGSRRGRARRSARERGKEREEEGEISRYRALGPHRSTPQIRVLLSLWPSLRFPSPLALLALAGVKRSHTRPQVYVHLARRPRYPCAICFPSPPEEPDGASGGYRTLHVVGAATKQERQIKSPTGVRTWLGYPGVVACMLCE
eukprot:GHVT01077920.1.p1 GENE.GHVT01077920.1~~GHVT01077920.1.p1  ORF type:complete len:265 (-),score=27.91 GHVT01077920.1:337-1131(-)